ncbi:uncharacterized protein LOC110851777 isoform X2 [Folsomia candida]|nr:uncharacterized protein LOC110851777 isoform X2 [Folsomia candida]
MWSPRCWDGASSSVKWSEQICSGFGDPLTFYLTAHWALDSLSVTLVVVAAGKMSGSRVGGLLSGLTFVLSHPQFGDWTRMFPNGDRIGLFLASVHVFMISQLVIRPLHASWTTVVKLGVVTGLMAIFWPMEVQWVLISELGVVLALHFSNVVSPYVVSVVVGAHVVGWEYASLVVLDPTLRCWTFYVYLLLGTLGVTFGLRLVVDKLFGAKLDKWLFLRGIILTVGLYVLLVETRHGVWTVLGNVKEDIRMSRHLRQYPINLSEGVDTARTFPPGAFATTISSDESGAEESNSLEIMDSWEEDRNVSQISLHDRGQHSPHSHLTEGGHNPTTEMGHSQGDDELLSIGRSEQGGWRPTKAEVVTATALKQAVDADSVEVGSSGVRNVSDTGQADLHMNELTDYLTHCLVSAMTTSPVGRLHQVLLDHIAPLSLALGAITSFHREIGKLVAIKGCNGSSSREARLCRSAHFDVVISIACLALSVLVHDKFAVLFFVQLSLIASYLLFRLDIPRQGGHGRGGDRDENREVGCDYWKWGNNVTLRRLMHSARSRTTIVTAVVFAMVIAAAKRKMDFIYESPHQFLNQGDAAGGKEELVSAIKWIRDQTPLNNVTFLGPSPLLTTVYGSGDRPVVNLEDVNNLSHGKPPPSAAVLSLLFNSKLSLGQLCQILNDDRTTTASTYLFLSRDFCLNPAYPHSRSLVRMPPLHSSPSSDGMSGDDIKGEPTITLRQKEKADEILGMKMRSKLHRQKELRNGVVSDISTSDFEPIDNPSCNLIRFWDDKISNSWNEGRHKTTESSPAGQGRVPCMRLFSSDTELEIKPFRRVFHNRLYSVLTCARE